jgi:hypothetical protein
LKKRWLWFGLVLVAAGLAVGWIYKPKEDYSSPKATAKTFYVALMRGYEQIARNSLLDPKQAEILPDMRVLVENVIAAQEAAEKKWGTAGKGVNSGLPSLKDIEEAQETTNGNSAVLIPRTISGLRAKFEQVGGQWKLDLLSTFQLEQETPAVARELMQAMAKGAGDVKAGIESGRVKSAEEADQKLKASLVMPVATLRIEREAGRMFKGLWGK